MRSNESLLNELGNMYMQASSTHAEEETDIRWPAIYSERTDLMSTVFQGKVKGKRNSGRPPSSLAIKTQKSVARNFRRWSDLAKVETDGGDLRGHRCAVTNTVPGDAERRGKRKKPKYVKEHFQQI
ncbi:hypothetical protein ElyMa_001457800 [Elysia marginata]|uniref:Uncharacterized protein n=1 Tax=Elysia marginata TaxID=1093978 RepID=A0AAV4IZF1_9GAST|nr:hypothetical protein ElyMa_001457800 [Elysia marginata]